MVIAAYAGTNPLRRALGLPKPAARHELTEVVLCDVADQYRGIGITVVDGHFFSFMPFGWTDAVSVTNVSLTLCVSLLMNRDFRASRARKRTARLGGSAAARRALPGLRASGPTTANRCHAS